MDESENVVTIWLDEPKEETYQDRLRKLRKEHKGTQKQVAEYLGMSSSLYGSCERGNSEFTIDAVLKLCKVYNVTINQLLDPESIDAKTLSVDHIILIKLYDQVPPEVQRAVVLLLKVYKEKKNLDDVLDLIKNLAPEELYEMIMEKTAAAQDKPPDPPEEKT